MVEDVNRPRGSLLGVATNRSDLTANLLALHRRVRVILSTVAHQHGLTVQQVELMCLLTDRRPSFGELAELLGCDKTNITGMADRLARRGFVDREQDPADRRVTRLVLTANGRQFGDDLKTAVGSAVTDRWGEADESERAVVRRLATLAGE